MTHKKYVTHSDVILKILDLANNSNTSLSLKDLKNKCLGFKLLTMQERLCVINKISVENNILVFITRLNNSNFSYSFFIRHKKFGYPKEINNSTKFYQVTDLINKKFCFRCLLEKNISEFMFLSRKNEQKIRSSCKECDTKRLRNRFLSNSFKGKSMNKLTQVNKIKTAKELRLEAEKLLREADEADKKTQSNEYVNKTIKPLILTVLQHSTKIQKNVDDLITNTADFEKSISELRKIMQ